MNVHLLRRAHVALSSALQLRAGEQLTLVVDDTIDRDLVDAMTAAAEGLGAGVVVVRYTPVEPVAMSEFGLFAGASQRPQPHLPAAAAAAIRAADAAVILNSDMAMMFDHGLRSVIEEGSTKIAWAPYASEDAFLRLLPRSEAECAALVAATEAVAARLAGTHEVRVTSPAGTDLVLRIGAHRVNVGTGSASGVGYGGLEIWPGGQVSVVPDHSTASGRLVIDRSINAPRFRELSAPIVFTVVQGDVIDVGGSGEAEELGQWLATLGDPAVHHLTELGVGTNPQCRLAGVAAPCEDTHNSGCVSFALGADVHLGGNTTAPCHVDMTMRAATLELDGEPVVSRGKVV